MIVVGAYQLDVERCLLVGSVGTTDVSPLAGRFLRFLAERPGIVVSRAELIDALWAGNYLAEPSGQRNAQGGATSRRASVARNSAEKRVPASLRRTRRRACHRRHTGT
jgi:hypothetical protein